MEERIKAWALGKEWIEARQVFNVTVFYHLGNFLAAADGGGAVVRLEGDERAEALTLPAARPWRMGPQSRNEYILIPGPYVEGDDELHGWLEKSLTETAKLPPKDRLITKKPTPPDWKTEGEPAG